MFINDAALLLDDVAWALVGAEGRLVCIPDMIGTTDGCLLVGAGLLATVVLSHAREGAVGRARVDQ